MVSSIIDTWVKILQWMPPSQHTHAYVFTSNATAAVTGGSCGRQARARQKPKANQKKPDRPKQNVTEIGCRSVLFFQSVLSFQSRLSPSASECCLADTTKTNVLLPRSPHIHTYATKRVRARLLPTYLLTFCVLVPLLPNPPTHTARPHHPDVPVCVLHHRCGPTTGKTAAAQKHAGRQNLAPIQWSGT